MKSFTRIGWVDMARGLCMTTIIWYHTESYYIDTHHVLPYQYVIVNVLCAFFFLSGMFVNKYANSSLYTHIKHIIKTLVVPYFVYALLTTLPKAFIHGNFISLNHLIYQVVAGKMSWFITALALAQVVFSVFLHGFKQRKILIGLACFSSFLLYTLIPFQPYNWWNINQAFMLLPFLYMGYVYKSKPIALNFKSLVALSLIFTVLRCVEYRYDIQFFIYPLFHHYALIWLIDGLVGSLLLINIAHVLPSMSWLSYTGKHSLMCYFLCGGVPLVVAKSLQSLGLSYTGQYVSVLSVFVLNHSIILFIVYLWTRVVAFVRQYNAH